jgi:hypothetical protein
MVEPREFVVENTTVLVEAEGVGGLDSDAKVLVDVRVDPSALVVVRTVTLEEGTGVTVETDVMDPVIVDPSEFVDVNGITVVEPEGSNARDE